jgi:hypothetical protein
VNAARDERPLMAFDELKTAAEIARQRLVHGLWRLDDARSWADGIIVGMEKPHEWLIDVSTARTTAEARDALLLAEGEPDAGRVWADLMGDWLQMLDAAPERDSEIGKALFDLAAGGEVPAREAYGAMYSFWDSIDLAKQGTFGVLEEERAKLRDFLRLWSGTRDAEPGAR